MKERGGSKLGNYRGKRAPEATNEPFGDELPVPDRRRARESGAFVVHLHDATRRHYDVRLEVGGVLMSFAVPRGPEPRSRREGARGEDGGSSASSTSTSKT